MTIRQREGEELKLPSVAQRVSKLLLGGMLACAMAVPAGMAFAADNQPSAGEQNGSGKTTFKLIAENISENMGATGSGGSNPDGNNDGLGDNLAFTAPTEINFVVRADGTLIGPSNAKIENRSSFPTYVSSLATSVKAPWTFVEDASTATEDNAVQLSITCGEDTVNLASYSDKTSTSKPWEWNMGSDDLTQGSGNDTATLSFGGKVAHVTRDITQLTEFGSTTWYVTPGEATEPFNMMVYTYDGFDGTAYTTSNVGSFSAQMNSDTDAVFDSSSGSYDYLNGPYYIIFDADEIVPEKFNWKDWRENPEGYVNGEWVSLADYDRGWVEFYYNLSQLTLSDLMDDYAWESIRGDVPNITNLGGKTVVLIYNGEPQE